MMKVLISELIWEEGIEVLRKSGISVDYDESISNDPVKLRGIIDNYDGLIIRNKTKIDEALLEECVKLKVIGRLGVGLDNIDIPRTKEKGISIVAAKHANATSVAEYVLASMLDASRDISRATIDVRNGGWNRKNFTGVELNGKTLALFGLGEIAHRVAKRAKAFGMNLIGYDPFITPYDHVLAETGVQKVNSVEALLKDADFISIHVPLTKDTQNVFNAEAFEYMKKNAYIINTARGGIIHEADLCTAVKAGKIAGAYLDVLETEPPEPNSVLFDIDAIKLTPHIAGLTEESQVRTSVLIAEEVVQILEGKSSLCSI